MQALAIQTKVTLFGFEGVEKPQPFREEEGSRKASIKVFFAYFLVHKKVSGGDKRDRTVDPLLAKQVLSQLSYTPVSSRVRPLN